MSFRGACDEKSISIIDALKMYTYEVAWTTFDEKERGSLEKGKQADFLLLDGESPAILGYHAGVSPVVDVYKHGEKVS